MYHSLHAGQRVQEERRHGSFPLQRHHCPRLVHQGSAEARYALAARRPRLLWWAPLVLLCAPRFNSDTSRVPTALWEPSLPYNFLYAAAKSPMQLLMRYFVARELGVANTLQRHFDWISSMLRPIDIPNVGDSSKVAVFLAERDAIVDSSRVAAYLKGEGWDESNGVRVWKKQRHGESMMGHGESFEAVMQW